jgi:SAM-dependent methyltransferase
VSRSGALDPRRLVSKAIGTSAEIERLENRCDELQQRCDELLAESKGRSDLTDQMAAIVERLDWAHARLDLHDRQLTEIVERLNADHRRGVLHEQQLAEIVARLNTDHELGSLHGKQIEDLAGQVNAVRAGFQTLSEELHAVPYIARPELLLQGSGAETRLAYDEPIRGEEPYLLFESVFRGDETLILERQRPYLNYIEPSDVVVDIGCGRGEMLDLLAASGIKALGVDLDEGMIAHCRSKGHDVALVDALEWLRQQGEQTIDVIFSAQVIEHIPYTGLLEFIRESRRVLRPGGRWIAETVNPHSVAAWKTFWTDLSHERPIFPESLLMLCMGAGFDRASCFFPLGTGRLDDDRRTCGEYAVIAYTES